MPISNALGIPFKNTKKYAARNGKKPCLTNAVFWGVSTDDDTVNSRLVNGNEFEGKLINSNCLTLNKIDNYIKTNGLLSVSVIDSYRQTITFKASTTSLMFLLGSQFERLEMHTSVTYIRFIPTAGLYYDILFSEINFNTTDYFEFDFHYDTINQEKTIQVKNLTTNTIYTPILYESGATPEYTKPTITTDIYTTGARNTTIGGLQYFFGGQIITSKLCINETEIYNVEFQTEHSKVYNKVSGDEYQISGTLTNIWTNKQDVYHANTYYPVDVWTLDSDQTKKIYVPTLFNGTSIKGEFDIIAGYTWKYKTIIGNGIVPFVETEIDFTNGGANAPIDPLLNSWKYGDVNGLEGSQFFFKVIKDDNDNIIGIQEPFITSNAQTGQCVLKTLKYNNLFPQYALADSEGNLLQDSEGNYLITADWYR